jgi:hypothetical protein
MLLRCESLEPPMSQLGQTRPSRAIGDMSPIPPITAVVLQRHERQKRAMAQNRCAIARCAGCLTASDNRGGNDR